MRNKVLVYADEGSVNVQLLTRLLRKIYDKTGINVYEISAKDIIEQNVLNDTALAFFMPGGASLPFAKKLGARGKNAIRLYVERGGIYYGICAGAYFACEKIVFESNISTLQIITDNCLGLIKAQAHGTLHPYLNMPPFSHTPASEAVVPLIDEDLKTPYYAHYHGGPYFVLNKESQTKVLARYNLAPFFAPAIVAEQKGQGLVIASGVHFEVDGAALFKIIPFLKEGQLIARKTACKLSEKEALRQALVRRLLSFARCR